MKYLFLTSDFVFQPINESVKKTLCNAAKYMYFPSAIHIKLTEDLKNIAMTDVQIFQHDTILFVGAPD